MTVSRRLSEQRPSTRHRGPALLGRLLRTPLPALGLVIISVLVLAALLAPVLFPQDPLRVVTQPLLWPGTDPRYPLGSDSLGRDVLSGIVHGARVSLTVGISAAAVSLALGVSIGAIAGYSGGWADIAITRLAEIVQTMPTFVFVVVVVAISGPTIASIAATIGIMTCPEVLRLTRSEFRALRHADYVSAARIMGYSSRRIILTQILPNALPPIIVQASMVIASAIMMESALAFMGLGDPNKISWGSMIGSGREYLRSNWYLCTFPGLAIMVCVASLNFLSDGLNDALDPRNLVRGDDDAPQTSE